MAETTIHSTKPKFPIRYRGGTASVAVAMELEEMADVIGNVVGVAVTY